MLVLLVYAQRLRFHAVVDYQITLTHRTEEDLQQAMIQVVSLPQSCEYEGRDNGDEETANPAEPCS